MLLKSYRLLINIYFPSLLLLLNERVWPENINTCKIITVQVLTMAKTDHDLDDHLEILRKLERKNRPSRFVPRDYEVLAE